MNGTIVTKGLTSSGLALVVVQFFRMLFGGYLVGFDLYFYNDLESAVTVLVIHAIVGILTVLFLLGNKRGLTGLVVLSIALLVLESIFLVVFYSQPVPDPSWHDPLGNYLGLVGNFVFPLLTLFFALKVYREET